MNSIKCPECHTENGPDDETCSNCGSPLPAEASRSADADWLSDLSEMIASVQSNEEEPLVPEGLPDWLEADQSEQEDSGEDEEDELLAWLRDIRPMGVAESGEEQVDEDLPEWLDRATGSLRADVAPPQSEGTEETQSPATELGLIEEETVTPAKSPDEPLPTWVSELTTSEEWPDTVDDAAVVDWFAHQDEDEESIVRPSEELPMTQPLNPTKELRGVPRQIASESLPEWLSDQIEEAPDQSELFSEELDHADEVRGAADTVKAQQLESVDKDKHEDGVPGLATSTEEQPGVLPPSPNEEWLALLDEPPASIEDSIESAIAESSSPDAMQVHDADIPEWLLALRPGASGELAGPAVTSPEESSGPLAGLRGVIPVAPVIAGDVQALQAAPYVESKEQQRQIALLQQLTSVGSEPDDRASEQSSGATFAMARIFIGAALLIFAVLGWLLPSLGVTLPIPAPAEVPDAAREAYGTLNNASGRTTLVAFEYTPALAGELDAVAGTLLRHLADNGSPVITVSQSAAGSAVAERAVTQIAELESYSLGFIAGEAIGLRQLAECLEDSSSCQMLSNRSIDGAGQVALEDISLIVVLAGERDSLSNWIEQVGSQSDSAMVAGVAQQLGPVAAPYQASEQLSGYLNGVPAAAAYEQRLRGNEEYAAEWLTSLTLVHWLVIAVLMVGSLYFGLMGLASARVRKAGM